MFSFLAAPFNSVYDFLKRNQTAVKVVGGTALCVGAYYGYQKIKPILNDVKSMMEMIKEQKEVEEKQAMENDLFVVNFRSNMKICESTVHTLALSMRSKLISLFRVEEVRSKLRKGAKTPEELLVWNQWKVLSFSRLISTLYSVSVMHSLVHVLNAVYGRYVSQDIQNNQKQNSVNEPSSNNELDYKSYLLLCNKWESEGVVALAAHVQQQVELIMNEYPLNMLITEENLAKMIGDIRSKVEGNGAYMSFCGNAPFSSLILPNIEDSASLLLKDMVIETRFILNSGSFDEILKESFDTCFQEFHNHVMLNVSAESLYLAKLVPKVELLFEQFTVDSSVLINKLAVENIRDLCGIIYFPLSRSMGLDWKPVPVIRQNFEMPSQLLSDQLQLQGDRITIEETN